MPFRHQKGGYEVMKPLFLILLIFGFSISKVWAGDNPPTPESNKTAIELVQSHADYVWTLLAAALVFFMQAGFAMVETGFTRAKNAINIMMKNLMDFAIGSIAYWAIGFGLMFGATTTGWFGTSGFFLSDFKPGGDPWVLAFWMFQVVFAATAATIVSGAMAERTKFSGYLIYSFFIIPFSAAGPGGGHTTGVVGSKNWVLSILPGQQSCTP
jgi:Amt family ammonium transporter